MKPSAMLALLFAYLAMWGAVVVARDTFEFLPHLEDEFAYLYQARIFEQGDVVIDSPEPRRAYWQPFLIDYEDKRFGKYPPGWPLLLAFGTGTQLPWVVNVYFAGLTVAIVYRLGRELYNDSAGVIAALLMTISPISLLLSGTLMSHTSALFFVTLFIYSLWRIEMGRRVLFWGAVGGFSLGINIAMRPLSAVGIAFPFVIYSLGRLVWILADRRHELFAALKPLLVLGVVTLLVGAMWPAFNEAATGDPTKNLYTFIWKYDKVGFGEEYGRSGHTLEKGWKHAKQDSACYVRDLFGWTLQPDKPPEKVQPNNGCVTDQPGVSWVLLPFGLIFMHRRKWSLLFVLLAASLVTVHLAYWIGAQVYSARYYFEMTSALVLVSAAGVAGLAQFMRRFRLESAVYVIFGIAIVASLIGYTPDRLYALKGYGRISQAQIQQVERFRHSSDTPVMVIVRGKHHWRDVASLMALTDPYARNEIILLRDPEWDYFERLRREYPDRQVMIVTNQKLYPLEALEQAPMP